MCSAIADTLNNLATCKGVIFSAYSSSELLFSENTGNPCVYVHNPELEKEQNAIHFFNIVVFLVNPASEWNF